MAIKKVVESKNWVRYVHVQEIGVQLDQTYIILNGFGICNYNKSEHEFHGC